VSDRLADGLNLISASVLRAAIEVHRALGPGLLESVYEDCLALELSRSGVGVAKEVEVPLSYKGEPLGRSLRLDLLVGGEVIVEVKAVDKLAAIHTAQLLSYLRLTDRRLGLLLNFNVEVMRSGIKRVVNSF